jgi:hypothetical protein
MQPWKVTSQQLYIFFENAEELRFIVLERTAIVITQKGIKRPQL